MVNSESWYLDFHDSQRPFIKMPELDLDVAALARENGARDGTPIFVSPEGRPDARLNRFWRTPSARSLSSESAKRYAYSIKVWLNFLHACGAAWDSVTPGMVGAFKEWRLSSIDAPEHVTATTFQTDLAALRRLYDWAADEHGVVNPIHRRAGAVARDGYEPLELRPSGSRRVDVK